MGASCSALHKLVSPRTLDISVGDNNRFLGRKRIKNQPFHVQFCLSKIYFSSTPPPLLKIIFSPQFIYACAEREFFGDLTHRIGEYYFLGGNLKEVLGKMNKKIMMTLPVYLHFFMVGGVILKNIHPCSYPQISKNYFPERRGGEFL